MPARKRSRRDAGLDSSVADVEEIKDNPLLTKLRNMWEFASFMQYLFIFGRAVKVDEDFDMDEFESECLRPEPSQRLAAIGLALLKYVSSHRGLTLEIFDEYTRRQYLAKAPQRNPFGDDEEPNRFAEFDIFTKIRVLHQLSTWTLGNAERMRGIMGEPDSEQTQWRVDEIGWDSEERAYLVLDDDRLYRRTEAPIPPTPKKSKPKPKAKPRRSRGTRSSKRQKLAEPDDEDEADGEPDGEAEGEAEEPADRDKQIDAVEDDGFGGMTWECVAVTFDEYQTFLESIRRSRDPNEKALHKAITDDVLPIIEKRAEAQRQKALKRQREFENLQKMATAKRSGRLAEKHERQRQTEEAQAAEKKRLDDLVMARKEQKKQVEMEEARESRMKTREQRLKEREVKRILHEEELQRLEENSKNVDNTDSRISERQLKSEMERRQRELEKLAEEEDEWVFDCAVCGMHGENLDDGTHSIACEKCNIWQHSKCHGFKVDEAESDDFHFVCADCKRKEEEAKKPKIPPLRLHKHSNSPQAERSMPADNRPDNRPTSNGHSYGTNGTSQSGAYMYNGANQSPRPGSSYQIMNGPALSPQGQSPGPPGYQQNIPPPVGVPQQAWQGSGLPPPQRPTSAGYGSSPPAMRRPTNMHAGSPPPPFQLHQQAHASAVASSNMPQVFGPPPHVNYSNGMPPPSPQKNGHSRPSTSYDQDQRRTSLHSLNGIATPHQPRPSSSPSNQQQAQLFQSPNTSFPPPQMAAQHQRAAGYSPVKQPSSSPVQSQHQQRPFYTPNSTHQANPHQTPQTGASGILRPSPGGPMGAVLHSSPIPPLPLGNGPVIPQKHDTPRPVSRDSIGDVPILPPITSLSPSAPSPTLARPQFSPAGIGSAEIDRRISSGLEIKDGGVKGVVTEFGEGSVPVKRLPPPAPIQGDDAVMRDM
ncbi:hypothetical protein MBLNU459_g7034t1 [Dothideomycetes sp. NU459]